MTIIYASAIAALGVFTGVAHSTIGERAVFAPLYAEDRGGVLAHRATRDVIRAVWHLPSVTWAVVGLAVLVARLAGGDPYVSIVAGVVYAVSGLANLTALRRPHFGGLLLVAMAGLVAADWFFSG